MSPLQPTKLASRIESLVTLVLMLLALSVMVAAVYGFADVIVSQP